VSAAFKQKLFIACCKAIKTRGAHHCSLCQPAQGAKIYTAAGKKLIGGSGVLSIKGRKWKTYLAPDLIFHYVVDHNYRPPDEFVNAVTKPRKLLTLNTLCGIAFILAMAGLGLNLKGYDFIGLLFFLPMAIGTILLILYSARQQLRKRSTASDRQRLGHIRLFF
jgi:hypothetical protein